MQVSQEVWLIPNQEIAIIKKIKDEFYLVECINSKEKIRAELKHLVSLEGESDEVLIDLRKHRIKPDESLGKMQAMVDKLDGIIIENEKTKLSKFNKHLVNAIAADANLVTPEKIEMFNEFMIENGGPTGYFNKKFLEAKKLDRINIAYKGTESYCSLTIAEQEDFATSMLAEFAKDIKEFTEKNSNK